MTGPMKETILITGAGGYIGSHFGEALLESETWKARSLNLVFLDDLSTGHAEFIETLTSLANEKGWMTPSFERVSLLDSNSLREVFLRYRPKAVVHFAAKISVAESVEKPELYFSNNVDGSKNLLAAMRESGCQALIFSSTAAVYGSVTDPARATRPLAEDTPLAPINPYGESKLRMEQEIAKAGEEWGLRSVIFRYFNAAGASSHGRLGEWHDPETHLIPLLLRSLESGKALKVFGSDYATRDGSCIRDYIHVSDLASAHLLGLFRLLDDAKFVNTVFNLGTASGTSVLEVIAAAEPVTNKKAVFEIHGRRPGDSAILVADSTRAREQLGWQPTQSDIQTILKTAWAWEHRLKNC